MFRCMERTALFTLRRRRRRHTAASEFLPVEYIVGTYAERWMRAFFSVSAFG